MKLIPSLCKLIGKAMKSHDLPKDFIKDIFLCTIWKCVLKFWILLILEEERFLILKEHILKNNPQYFFFLFEYAHFENQKWLEIMPIEYWMNGWTLRLWPWGDWESLGAHASSSGLFIKGNLRAHVQSWTKRIFFGFFFFDFFFAWSEKCKQ